MCGFDDNWRCPNHKRTGTDEPAFCPPGGCSEQGGCTIDKAKMIELLTGERVPLETVHTD